MQYANVIGRIIARDFERRQLLLIREVLWIARQTNSNLLLQNATEAFYRQLDRVNAVQNGASLELFKTASYRT